MMWSTFIVKRLSAAAYLMEKASHAHIHPSIHPSIHIQYVCVSEVKASVRQCIKCLHFFFFLGGESTQRSLMSTGKFSVSVKITKSES